eukprot:37913-Rhodomonas_salina.2
MKSHTAPPPAIQRGRGRRERGASIRGAGVRGARGRGEERGREGSEGEDRPSACSKRDTWTRYTSKQKRKLGEVRIKTERVPRRRTYQIGRVPGRDRGSG